jgi:hypothetical protein
MSPSTTRTWWTRCLASWGLQVACQARRAKHLVALRYQAGDRGPYACHVVTLPPLMWPGHVKTWPL